MATKIRLDMDSLTLGDLELFEEACGGDLFEALRPQRVLDEKGHVVPDPDDPKGRPLMQVKVNAKSMVGLVYIALHKDNPSITLEEVRQMPLNDMDFDLAGINGNEDDAADPTETSGSETAGDD